MDLWQIDPLSIDIRSMLHYYTSPASWPCIHATLLHPIIFYCHHFQLSICNWPSAHSSNAHFLSSTFSFAIVVTVHLTIFMTTSTSQYTILSYMFGGLKLRQFLQYLPKHALESSSCFTTLKDWQSGLDM